MQVREVISRTTKFFGDHGIETARLDAELLLAHTLKCDRVQLYLRFDYPLQKDELEDCRDLVRRRAMGEPVAYLIGQKDFYKSTFRVRSGVLIPRPETELVVETALQLVAQADLQAFRAADFGCGTGCIGQSLLLECSQMTLFAVDSSATAIETSAENAERLGLSDRVEICLDRVQNLGTRRELLSSFNLVVANPPYIAVGDAQVADDVRAFEPSQALFAGPDGLSEIRSWVAVAFDLLKPSAWLVTEIGFMQARSVGDIFSDQGLIGVSVHKDMAGRDRVVIAQKPGC